MILIDSSTSIMEIGEHNTALNPFHLMIVHSPNLQANQVIATKTITKPNAYLPILSINQYRRITRHYHIYSILTYNKEELPLGTTLLKK